VNDNNPHDDLEPAAIGLGIVFALLIIVGIIRLL
jgi:hypothetical protein